MWIVLKVRSNLKVAIHDVTAICLVFVVGIFA